MQSLESRLFTFADDTVVHPGHGLDTTIGTERPSLPAWKARGW
jgi:glyoxylase-like metal-dependent hydrolase (beta-lactamase superfamily II)